MPSSPPPSASSRLEWANPFRLSFDAKVARASEFAGKPSVLLDQSAFYPESGGQMGDHGVLRADGATLSVVDAQVDADGQVHHILDAATDLAPGTEISGSIDGTRRREFAALHTGQHVLSSALMQVWEAETVSSRLGETSCNIDLDKNAVSEAKLAEAEALANAVVDDALEVRQFFPSAEELATLDFRRAPKVTDGIRVVTVGDFDVTPCGGTHVRNSAEIGLIRITNVERAKGRVRVLFESGPRARKTLFDNHSLLRDLAASLTCGAAEVPRAIEKLKESLSHNRSALGALRSKLAEIETEALLAKMRVEEVTHVVSSFEGNATVLRQVAPRLLDGGAKTVVLAGKHPEGVALLCTSLDGALDCGTFVKAATTKHGGRGGGKSERAEGRLDASADVETLVADATAALSSGS